MKNRTKALVLSCLFTAGIASQAQAVDMNSLVSAAKKEGEVNSVGMPDSWANWKDTWADLNSKYGLSHSDTDMSSAQEIAKMKAEGKNATADIGDVGFSFGPIAAKQGVTQPFKPSTWNQIPQWAKDKDGHWMLAYTGTIAFIINNNLVSADERPKSWGDLKNGSYKISIGDVGAAAQSNSAVLGAAFAFGGDEKNLKPALKLFGDIAKQGRLALNDVTLANLEKGEIEVGIMWDFNALNYADKVGRDRFTVLIPNDGSIISGYTTIINKHAKNPNAAKLAREYILSDEGQVNLAKGYARPIRAEHITLPAEVQAKLLPNEQYAKARPIQDFKAWAKTAKRLPRKWQENVLIHQN